MLDEPNLYSRNLKLISILFIMHWVLDLHLIENQINLASINFKIGNPYALSYASYILLMYFAWRFYLNSKNRISFGFYGIIDGHSLLSENDFFNKKFHFDANSEYVEKCKKDIEDRRRSFMGSRGIHLDDDKHNNSRHSINLNKIEAIKKNFLFCKIRITYRSIYHGGMLGGFPDVSYSIDYSWNKLKLFRVSKLLHFLLNTEDTPDFLLPWLLFAFAAFTIFLDKSGIGFSCVVSWIRHLW